MVWVGKDFKHHLVPTPLPQAGVPSTRPGCTEKGEHYVICLPVLPASVYCKQQCVVFHGFWMVSPTRGRDEACELSVSSLGVQFGGNSDSAASDLLRKEEAGVVPSGSYSRVRVGEVKGKSPFQQEMSAGMFH